MRVLMIDRDREHATSLAEALEVAGVSVTSEPTRSKVNAWIAEQTQPFEAILIDPAPQQNELRPFIMSVRRQTAAFTPIIVIAHTLDVPATFALGANDYVMKPASVTDVVKKIENAARLNAMTREMADIETDFPSKDGLIAKSAFNQLYIICLNRADRYGEFSYIITISIRDRDELLQKIGATRLAAVEETLKRTLARIRRLSDIAGHVGNGRFCIMLLRPVREDEPMLAVQRFSEAVRENMDLLTADAPDVHIDIELLEIPTGAQPYKKTLSHLDMPAPKVITDNA